LAVEKILEAWDHLDTTEKLAVYGACVLQEYRLEEARNQPIWIPPSYIYDVELMRPCDQETRMRLIAGLRTPLNLTMVEARQLVDRTPIVLVKNASLAETSRLQRIVANAGGYSSTVQHVYSEGFWRKGACMSYGMAPPEMPSFIPWAMGVKDQA
jgi:ribosomal protein L7/L12